MSNFSIERHDKGFTISHSVGTWKSKPVTFELRDNLQGFKSGGVFLGVGHLRSHYYIELMFKQLYNDYTPTKFVESKFNGRRFMQLGKIRDSVAAKTAKCYSKLIKIELDRLRTMVDQDWLAVERKCFSTIGPKKYGQIFALIHSSYDKVSESDKKYYLEDFKNYSYLHYRTKANSEISGHREKWIKDWLSKATEGSNLYVKKTVMNLSGGILSDFVSPDVFKNKTFHKILNRTEASLFLQSYKIFNHGYNVAVQPFKEITHLVSDVKDIKRAAVLYSKSHAGSSHDLRKRTTLHNLIMYLRDYPQYSEHTGSLTGLMRKALLWHRTTNYKRAIEGIDPSQETAKPPQFILDAIDGKKEIAFLHNAEAVANEGVNMGHCIGTYAKAAIQGKSYLFHIEKDGELASIELNRGHRYYTESDENAEKRMLTVGQSKGPHNQINKASKWAEKFFQKILSKQYGTNKEKNTLALTMGW